MESKSMISGWSVSAFRNSYWYAIVWLGIMGLLGSLNGAEKPGKNVVIFFIDDLRPELGCYGTEGIKSPHIDQLASQGILFERAYCQQAVCAPSRASMLSSQYPDSTGIYDLEHPLRKNVPDVMSMPRFFREHGYVTATFGKVYHHFSDDKSYWTEMPDKPGQLYCSPQTHARLKKLNAKATQEGLKGLARYSVTRGPATESVDVPDNAYQDGAVADQAIASLRRNQDKPFFMCVGFIKPHLPFAAPQKYWDWYQRDQFQVPPRQIPEGAPDLAVTNWGELRSYSDIPKGRQLLDDDKTRELIHGYHACVSFTDAQVGRVLNELDRLGLRQNTVVVLWGDHGWKLGDYGLWCKHTNFELDTHVPLIMRVPGLKPDQRTRSLVEMVDVFPTLAELATGGVPEQCQGRSLVQLLHNVNQPFRSYALSQYPRKQNAIMGYSMRTDRWRFTEWVDSRTNEVIARELYDQSKTVRPTKNLAWESEYAKLVQDLSVQLKPHQHVVQKMIQGKIKKPQ